MGLKSFSWSAQTFFFTVQPSPQPRIDYKYVPRLICLLICVFTSSIYQGFNTINLNSKKWLILMNQESDFLWPSLTLRAQYYEGFQKNLSRGITAHFTTQFNVGSWWLTSWQNPSTTYFKTSRKNLSKHSTVVGIKLGKNIPGLTKECN